VLLVKPFGQSRKTVMRTSRLPTTTLDIAWIMRQAISQPNKNWRLELQRAITGRNRYFHVASKKNFLRRYAMEGNEPVFAGTLSYNNTPMTRDSAQPRRRSFPVNAVIEAEDGGLSSAVEVRSELPGASGPYVMSGDKSFRFEVDSPGVYALRARVISPSGNNNSTYVTMAGKRSKWFFRRRQEWTWFEYERSWTLEPGEHSLLLGYREPIFLDQIQLALKTAIPDVVIEAESGHLDGSVLVHDDRPGGSNQYITQGQAEFEVKLSPAQVYRLRARVLTTGPNAACDLWLEEGGAHSWSIGDAREWTWVTSPVDWKPPQGLSALRISPHEGLLLDQIELVTRD
jgi:hypothetical protein